MAFDKTLPDGDEPIRKGDNDIRANNEAVESAVDSEHYFASDGAQTGYHRQGSARTFSQATEPPATKIDGNDFDEADLGSMWHNTDDDMLYIATAVEEMVG